jgi:acyl transferase domain-containing protein
MLAVPLPEDETAGLLRPGLDLATINGPQSCVVAGPEESVESLRSDLAAQGITATRLRTSHAFHSAMMDPILDAFGERVARLRLHPPALPYLSNLTGTWITAAEARDPSYWVRHLRRTVRLGLAELDPKAVFVEVGPGRSLANLLRQVEPGGAVLPSLRHPTDPQPDRPFLLHTLGRLWLAGVEIAWDAVSGAGCQGRRRVALPTYPFERQRCWVESGVEPSRERTAVPLSRRGDPGDWLYAPVWKRTPPLPSWGGALPPRLQTSSEESGERPWLIFLDGSDLGRSIADKLRSAGRSVTTVEIAGIGDVCDPDGYVRLLKSLETLPGTVLHLWSLAVPSGGTRDTLERAQDLGFYSLLHLAQALVKRGLTAPVRILAVGSGLQEITGEEPLHPEASTLLGPCLVIPQEHPDLHCRALDIALPGSAAAVEKVAERILAEATSASTDPTAPITALRGGHRWVRELAPVPSGRPDPGALHLRRGGTYLITGGLGRIGLTVASFLAEAAGARIALLGRSMPATLPPREEWAGSPQLRRLLEIERLAGEVLLLPADVADPMVLAGAVAETRARFGRIDGVFHAAGLLGEGTWVSVAAAGRAACHPQLRPKALGVLALEEVFAGEPPDFFLLFSSISALLGGLGFAAYSAANLFLDTFAQSRSRAGGPPWVSVGWDAWRFGERQLGGPGALLDELALTPEDGTEVLRRLFSNVAAAPHLVVSTADPQARQARWVERSAPLPSSDTPETSAPQVSVHARPSLATPYAAPRDAEEERIAAIWGEVLGIEGIGVHDDFFELGGHSVMVTQIAARLRQSFQAEIRLERFFEKPTVAGLAEAVRASEEAARAKRLEEILLEIEGLGA